MEVDTKREALDAIGRHMMQLKIKYEEALKQDRQGEEQLSGPA
jgi:hypothetical protein